MNVKTYDPAAGEHLIKTLEYAVTNAPCRFKFNGWEFETRVGESLDDARDRFNRENGHSIVSIEELAANAAALLDQVKQKCAAEIKAAWVPTEHQLAASVAPSPDSLEELQAYIKTLTDRPHDYGTSVYAMSLAAAASFNYVASKLGVTGFQAGCADMDFIRRRRGIERFRILDYGNLLYPQYCSQDFFPSFGHLIRDEEIGNWLAVKAQKLIDDAEATGLKPGRAVLDHWKRLASRQFV